MKPSETLFSLIPVNASDTFIEIMRNVGFVLDQQEEKIKILLRMIEKPKYACPNCYRVVSELINVTSAEVGCDTLMAMHLQRLCKPIPIKMVDKKYCKHCDPRTRMEDKK